MGITGIWQWVIILAIVLILFARPGKISGIMGDFGKGLRNFRSGVKDDDAVPVDDADVDDVDAIESDGGDTREKAPPKKAAGKKKRAKKKKAAKNKASV